MANVVVTAPWSSLSGAKPTVSEIMAIFGQLEYQQTFRRLSHAAYIFCVPDERAHKQAIDYYLSDSTKRRLEIFRSTIGSPVQPFFRQQVLAEMKLIAMCHTKDGGKSPENDADRHQLGDALLIITNICLTSETAPITRDLINDPAPLNREFAMSMQIENPPDFRLHAARFYKLLFQFIPEALDAKKLPVKLWEDAYRMAYGTLSKAYADQSNNIFYQLRRRCLNKS